MLIVPSRQPSRLYPHAAPSRPLPKVSVVVACYGALSCTRDLVRSLQQHAGCEYDLLLVDDGCPEETWKWADQEGLRYLRHETNEGLPRTINDGAAAVDGELLALWNSDLIVRPGGLRRLAEAALQHGFAAQSGGLFKPGGQYAGQTSDYAWADYAEGYCLVVRRDVWERVGEWDSVYHPTVCDDTDWSFRARLAGYRFALVPDCVHHLGGQSTGSIQPAHVNRNQERLKALYASRGLGERILVKRWGAYGDLLMATPALRGLKRRWPLAKLHLQCHAAAGAPLAELPYVDAVFDSPVGTGRYTRVYDLNGAYENLQSANIWKHPAERFCAAADVDYDGLPYDLQVPAALQEWAAHLLPDPSGLIACGLRSEHRSKQNWHGAGWLSFAQLLPSGKRLVALDGHLRPGLSPWGASAADEAFYAHPQVLDLTGQTPSLLHAAALIQRCEAFVGVDSGLLHVAHALNKPVANLCAAAPAAARTPLAGRNLSLEGTAECFPCQAPSSCPRSDRQHCLAHIEPEPILTWLEDLHAPECSSRAVSRRNERLPVARGGAIRPAGRRRSATRVPFA